MSWLDTLAGKLPEEKAGIIQENYPKVIFSDSGIMYSMLKIDDDDIQPLNASDFDYKGVRHDYSKWKYKPDGDWDLINYEKEIYLQEFDNLYKTGTWQTETAIDELRREGHKEYPAWEYNVHIKFAAVASEIILDILPNRIEKDMERTVTTWWKIWKYGMRDDLAAYYHYVINLEEGTWKPMQKTEMKPREEWRFGCSFQAYISQVQWMEPMNRTLYTCMTAIDHAPGIANEALTLAKRILEAVDAIHLRWIYDPDGDQLSKYDKFMDNILSSEGPSTFLIAFWRGRVKGLW